MENQGGGLRPVTKKQLNLCREEGLTENQSGLHYAVPAFLADALEPVSSAETALSSRNRYGGCPDTVPEGAA